MFLPILISGGIRLFGPANTQRLLRHWALAGKCQLPPSDPLAEIRIAGGAQRIVRRTTGIGGTCLPRSLTLWALLLRRGLPTDLRLGFRRMEGKLEGHAWVEYQGTPLNDDRATIETYSAFKEPVSLDMWKKSSR